MNAPIPTPNTTGRLHDLAVRMMANVSYRQLGRILLVLKPLVSETGLKIKFNPTYEVQNEWVDEQLYNCIPWQSELSYLDDARFSALQSAWPEGFDDVVFSDGSQDDAFARALIEPYLEWAERFGLPLMSDFDATQVEMEVQLANEFRKLIVQWRENTLQRMEEQYAGAPLSTR